MKTALVRILAVATLATSMSAFAAADESKSKETTVAAANTQQDGCAGVAKKAKKNKKAEKTQPKDQDEQNFDHLLMGIYG